MSQGVTIPVKVEGAEAAGRDFTELNKRIADLEKQVAALNAGSGNAGKGQNNLNEEVKKGGDIIGDTDRKAEKFVKQTLGAMSPELARVTDFLFDMNEGFLKINGAMLGMIGAGIGLSAIVGIFQEMGRRIQEAAEAQDRLNKAQAEKRTAGLDLQGRIVAKGFPAGVADTTIDDLVVELGKKGIDEDIAIDAGVARGVAKRLGKDFDVNRWLRGFAVSGLKADFGADDKKNAKLLDSVLKAGDREDAGGALDTLIRMRGELAFRESLDREDINAPPAKVRTDTILRRMKESGKFDDEEMKAIERLAQNDYKNMTERVVAAIGPGEALWESTWQAAFSGNRRADNPRAFEFNSRRTVGDIMDLADQVRQQAAGAGGTPMREGQVIFNVNAPVTNIGTNHEVLPSPMARRDFESGVP